MAGRRSGTWLLNSRGDVTLVVHLNTFGHDSFVARAGVLTAHSCGLVVEAVKRTDLPCFGPVPQAGGRSRGAALSQLRPRPWRRH
jgi:hypothetical protein